jgi:hypothetical protein
VGARSIDHRGSDELFGSQDPLGPSIRVRNVPCEVIGALASKGQGMGGAHQDDAILMPIRTVQRRLNGHQDVNAIQVAVQSEGLIARARADVVARLDPIEALRHEWRVCLKWPPTTIGRSDASPIGPP